MTHFRSKRLPVISVWPLLTVLAAMVRPAAGQEAVIDVHAEQVRHRLSPYLVGACLEDVNHEVYGGLYSQMIFGESFQEPGPTPPIQGFTAYGGRWEPQADVLHAAPGDGPKLVADEVAVGDGDVSVEVFLPGTVGGNAGLIVRVSDPAPGADRFTGYEVALDTAGKLILHRHSQNWEPIREVPCPVPADRWIELTVQMHGPALTVFVDGHEVTRFTDDAHPLTKGRVGLRTWQRSARFRNLRVESGVERKTLAFQAKVEPSGNTGVSGMWRSVRTGTAVGSFALVEVDPFVGVRSQKITFQSGQGTIGVENQGLNRWGLKLVEGRSYEGVIWARADAPTRLQLALESRDGSRRYAESPIDVREPRWTAYAFGLTPAGSDGAGRFVIELKEPGSVVVGHAFLQPGEWGRFKGLSVRKDVAEAMVDQGLKVLRYGGSMINHPVYRWKTMIGERALREPTAGTWYPYSSNGWGIIDFLDFCEAAGFLAIPAFNMGETPEDMADFVEYVNGPVDRPWGRHRDEDGHGEPYRLKHIELGNEEAIDDAYWAKFQPIAEAIWARDPDIILIVGDFAYGKVIENPMQFEGGAVVNSLATHQRILELARDRGREVWFDIHVGTEQPPAPAGLAPERSYIAQLGKLCPGARTKVVFFEFNAGNHAQKRALANAAAINAVQRLGPIVPIACSANALQPDGQNDNGWDQGLLFLNPAQVWLQPPGHVSRMIAHGDLPLLVDSSVKGNDGSLDVTATRNDDGTLLALKVVNTSERDQVARIRLGGFAPKRNVAQVETLAAAPDAVNTAEHPDRVVPTSSEWRHQLQNHPDAFRFPASSYTILRLE